MLNKKWKIIIISFIFIVLSFSFAALFYIASLIPNQSEQNAANKKIDINYNYWLGSVDPKVTIIEFGDFACPYCHDSFSKVREIGINYKKDVKIIYKDLPIIKDYSLDLAMAGRCAGEQGMFWVMHDKLFLNQGVSTKEEIIELANQIGLEKIQFKNCLNSQKYLTEIQKDIQIANELKITGTPSWIINGKKIEGNIPYDIFIEIIESLIK